MLFLACKENFMLDDDKKWTNVILMVQSVKKYESFLKKK